MIGAMIAREVRRGLAGAAWMPMVFFLLVAAIVPFAVGPDAQLLARYERWRALDTLTIAAATDGLTRLFGVRGQVAAGVRNAGMRAIDRVGPLKRLLMNEARGSSGELPRLLQGLAV